VSKDIDRLVRLYFLEEVDNVVIPTRPALPMPCFHENNVNRRRQTILSVASSVIITGLSVLLLMQSQRITPFERSIHEFDRKYRIYDRTVSTVQTLQEIYKTH
jgi:hypothetical protein